MLYYYTKDGQTIGPMTRKELDSKVADGTITAKSYVFKKGYSAWVQYNELVKNEQKPVQAEAASVAPVKKKPVPLSSPVEQSCTKRQPVAQNSPSDSAPDKSGLMKFLSYNQWVDSILFRIFKLPRWLAEDETALHNIISLMPAIIAFVSWVVLVMCSLGMMELWMICAALFGGALFQYAIYLVCCMLASLLKGPRVVVSSMAGPRLIGFIALLSAIYYLYMAGYVAYKEVYGGIFLYLALTFVSIVATYVCFNADKLIVIVSPRESNPGRDFNNLLKFILRCLVTVQYLMTPLLMVASAVSFISVRIQILRIEDKFKSAGLGALYEIRNLTSQLDELGEIALLFSVATPIVLWLAYSLISYLLDLLDGLFSLGGCSAKEKTQNAIK